jgi:hypothetical protein
MQSTSYSGVDGTRHNYRRKTTFSVSYAESKQKRLATVIEAIRYHFVVCEDEVYVTKPGYNQCPKNSPIDYSCTVAFHLSTSSTQAPQLPQPRMDAEASRPTSLQESKLGMGIFPTQVMQEAAAPTVSVRSVQSETLPPLCLALPLDVCERGNCKKRSRERLHCVSFGVIRC